MDLHLWRSFPGPAGAWKAETGCTSVPANRDQRSIHRMWQCGSFDAKQLVINHTNTHILTIQSAAKSFKWLINHNISEGSLHHWKQHIIFSHSQSSFYLFHPSSHVQSRSSLRAQASESQPPPWFSSAGQYLSAGRVKGHHWKSAESQ